MKSKCSFILKTSVALLLAILMVFGSVSTVIAAVVDVSAGDQSISTAAKKGLDIAGTAANADLSSTGGSWIAFKRLYFGVPTSWSGSFTNLYAAARQTNGYCVIIGKLTEQLSGSRIYGTTTGQNIDHSSWGNAEYLYIFASDSSYNVGSGYSNPTVKSSYATTTSTSSNYVNITNLNSTSNTYFIYPKSDATGCGIGSEYTNYDNFGYLDATASPHFKQTVSSSTGGSSTISGYRVKNQNTSFEATSATNSYIYPFIGSKVTITATANSGYELDGFYSDSSYSTKITSGVSGNTYTYTVNSTTAKTTYVKYKSTATNYTGITAVAKGTTDGSSYSVDLGSIKSSTTVSSSTGLAVSAPTKTGYTFSKWVASGSGTFDNANNASTTFHPAANSEIATAQYKKNYTISKNDPTGGSVALSKTSAVAGDSYTVTLTPNDGYKVKSLTLNGSAVTVSNNKYTGKASGTSDTLAFVATFEANTAMNLYIAGRFHVKDSSGNWVNTFDSGDWNDTSTKIPFTYLSGTTYKVDTNATLAELSGKISNYDPVFFVYDTTNSKNWYASSATTMSTSGTTLVSSGGANSNLKFSSTSTDGPVTVYYDANTHKIWYSIPDLYNVTVSSVTGGIVTASPTRCEAGTSVTLTIAPSTGYQLKSITAKDSSNATVTLSGSGNTRTFTMPAKNVTVTPVFEKITWSGLTAVGKYSTTAANDASYSNDFPTGKAPNITIAATSATQLDGVAVSAPATDPTGYVFAGWYTAKGSFANPANKDTTFKPNAANAVAIAKYKKIFTITSSVDSTGTGAGTVTTSKTSVEAGGSYTITATAKSGSAVESVKVNGTAKNAASQTISSVSADQTVVVKFKSNVYLRGGSTIGTNWTTGDAMTSNADGTEFTKTYENVAGSSSGTQYQFKLYVNGYNNDGTATINITGGASTGTCTHQSSGDQNYVLTLKKAANVTVKSNGTKITEIKVVPANSTKHAVTFKKADNTTITGTYEGTNFTTASADATVQVYSGDEISFTVTAASGYHISALTSGTTPAFSPAVTKTYKLSNVTAAKTITPTAAADVNITAKTNKTSRGTVSVDKTKSFKGDTVKITVTPLAGSLKTLTATYSGNGKTYEYKNSNWTEVTSTTGSSTNNALLGAFLSSAKDKFALAPTGAETDEAAIAALPDLAPVGAAQTINMVMQDDSAVTINAVFDTYSADSTWYYNGYDKDSGNAVSGYHGKQMTESMVSGEKFSYYHVEGRTGTDQTFTVSNGAASSGTRYIYFTASSEGGWSTDENHQYAYFYNNSGDAGNAWPGYKMTKYTTNDYGQNVYRVEIPTSSSPTGVVFNNASNANHKTTNVTDLTKGGYYLLSTHHSDNGTEIHDWQSYDCSYPNAGYSTGTEYFYDNEIYTADFSTKGFYDHNVGSTKFTKPKDLGSDSGDYYINVLYAGKTYTINGVTKTIGSKPLVIWSAEPLAGDDENVTIYAKDGAIRGETFGATYANIADTKIYAANGASTVGTKHSGSITNQTYETYKAAKGDTIVIKTQIGATDTSTLSNAADLKAKYYVRGFCVNGEVGELLEWNANGLYTLTFKVPEDTEITKFEITPIYYLRDTEANPIVTYRVTGFTDELKQVGAGKPGWGDTLYTYPFYGKLGGQNNAFGAYPGQPMVYYKGQYQMQIPVKSTAWDPYGETASTVNNTSVAGVTMSNGYWDSVHKMIQGYGDNSTSADHVQTYDYGDFYKIFNEKKPVDNIVFDFKYRTKKHNFENQPGTTITKANLDSNYGTNGNGFELLTNFHGRNVDLFGTPLSGDAADPSKTTPVYVVSIGGVNGSAGVENIAGYYATEWMVYGSSNGSSYSRISAGGKNSIPPEVLVLNDDDNTSFNTTTYPSAVNTSAKPYKITDWKALYTALEAYRGKPVMISYEAADAQQGQEMYYTGTGGATRNDGRWLYSKNGENITSKIKIQYSDDNGDTYTDLNTTTPQVQGLSAYFTNDGVEGQMTYSTTIDPDKTFDFEAKTTNGNYKFVGWYMEDGTKITSDNASHTERSGSYTFVAKFMQVQSGQLILSHSADKGTISGTDYQGAGTAKIKAVVKDGDEVIRTYDLTTSDITLDDKIIKSDSTYTIDVTLEATATGNDNLGTTVLANPSGQDATYFSAASTTTDGKTKTIVLNSFTVASLFDGTTQQTKNIIYHSYFAATTFHYKLVFEYKDRNGDTKQYYRSGYLTAAQAANPNYVSVTQSTETSKERRLLPAFIETVAPHISNFSQEDVIWDIAPDGYQFSVMNYKYTLERAIVTRQRGNDKKNVTFVLPYAHNDGIATGGNTGTAATTTNFELTGENAVTFDTIPVLLNDAENGIYNEEGKKNWIAAPATLDDKGTTKYFQYWSVKSTAADKDTDPEVARCYFQGFNFCALDNYIVTPIYGDQSTDISNSGIYTGASFLETSRNQWNGNATTEEIDHYTVDPTTGKKKASAADRAAAADLLYNDFILNYNYKGVDIYKGNSDSDDIQELGVVVERVKELDINQDGSKITDVSHYASVEQHLDTINGIINGTVSTSSKYMKDTVAKTALDNKNRIKFYEAFYNGAGWVKDNQDYASKYTYKNYVYRAYTYIKYKDAQGNDQIKLSVPAYFTMYDEATANYKASTSTTSGN